MLKPQDCMLLLKLLANPGVEWSQRQLAKTLCISLAEVNAGIKRLTKARLIVKVNQSQFTPVIQAAEEFLISGLKYLLPGHLGTYSRGVPTAVGAPIFHNKIVLSSDPIPVWPDGLGEERGLALMPLYPSVTESLSEFPDKRFYELLVLVDAIRSGRARERNLAAQLLKEKISSARK